MPLAVQAKLLRVLQYGEFTTVGGSTTIKTDVRIVAATNKDLRILIQQGVAVELEPELGGDHDLVANWSERLAHEFFVRERPVHLERCRRTSRRVRPPDLDDRDYRVPVAGPGP